MFENSNPSLKCSRAEPPANSVQGDAGNAADDPR
jgi:hypothetical protein